MSPPSTPPSSSLSARVGGTGEKRGKESSDEDSGGEKGSHRSDEDEKGSIPDGSSGDDDYRQVRSKRQKLKEKKKRQKAKKKEDASRPALLLVPEEERKRLWILDVVKPSKDAIDQALAGHPDALPQLLHLLGIADAFCPDFACQDGIDPATSALCCDDLCCRPPLSLGRLSNPRSTTTSPSDTGLPVLTSPPLPPSNSRQRCEGVGGGG